MIVTVAHRAARRPRRCWLDGTPLPETHVERALVGTGDADRATPDPTEHRALLQRFEVLADGDGGDVELTAQLADGDPAGALEDGQDGLRSGELVHGIPSRRRGLGGAEPVGRFGDSCRS